VAFVGCLRRRTRNRLSSGCVVYAFMYQGLSSTTGGIATVSKIRSCIDSFEGLIELEKLALCC
jgi:hypothetical protein